MDLYEVNPNPDRFKYFFFPRSKQSVELRFHEVATFGKWVPFEVESTDVENASRIGDLSSIRSGLIPMYSERAVERLGPLLKDDVEFLPVSWRTQRFYLVHLLRTLDCLDKARSEIEWADDDDEPQETRHQYARRVRRFVFKRKRETFPPLFKIKELRLMALFCTGAFKEAVERRPGLKGFAFRPLPG